MPSGPLSGSDSDFKLFHVLPKTDNSVFDFYYGIWYLSKITDIDEVNKEYEVEFFRLTVTRVSKRIQGYQRFIMDK